MPKRGVEPPSPCEHWHLKPACLPFHHLGETVMQSDYDYTTELSICQVDIRNGRGWFFLKSLRQTLFFVRNHLERNEIRDPESGG